MSEAPLYYYQNIRSCEGFKQRDASEARGEEEPQEEVQGYLAHKNRPPPPRGTIGPWA